MNRPTNPEMELLLGKQIPVLDKGFIRVVDYMGKDDCIAQAARTSYGEGTKTVRENEGLIRYLMRHNHTSPFEMAEIKFHIKLPIFVARQWIRHRTASVNEVSARYSILSDEFYIPHPVDIHTQSSVNKQGRGEALPTTDASNMANIMYDASVAAFEVYEQLIARDVSREISRIVTPVNTYTEWYWKVNLHNLLHFLALRSDKHAQMEIRAYADEIQRIVERWVPQTYRAWCDYVRDSHTFSAQEMELLRTALAGANIDLTDSGLSKRERWEFLEAIGHG